LKNLAVAGSKSFIIDHPLDPENKYLIHYCIESPDRLNIYNGNVNTDQNGFAEVILPDYFDSINKNFQYQLTTVGKFAQAIVETEIINNRFTIRTDKPDVKVCWQVTSSRNDLYARTNPVEVELQKEDHARGKYLMPTLYNKPVEMGIYYTDVQPPIVNQDQFNLRKEEIINEAE
jgi:hypothetical protein